MVDRLLTGTSIQFYHFAASTKPFVAFQVLSDHRGKLAAMSEITRRTVLLACAAAVVLPQAICANANVDELSTMDATGLADLVRKGKVSALELVDAAIRRIEKLNPRINAVIWERFEKARQEAPHSSPYLLNGDLLSGRPSQQALHDWPIGFAFCQGRGISILVHCGVRKSLLSIVQHLTHYEEWKRSSIGRIRTRAANWTSRN